MPVPFHSRTSGSLANGTVETCDGSHVLRFVRHFHHAIEQVWAALTEPEQLVAWLAEAQIELRQEGRVQHSIRALILAFCLFLRIKLVY